MNKTSSMLSGIVAFFAIALFVGLGLLSMVGTVDQDGNYKSGDVMAAEAVVGAVTGNDDSETVTTSPRSVPSQSTERDFRQELQSLSLSEQQQACVVFYSQTEAQFDAFWLGEGFTQAEVVNAWNAFVAECS